MASKIRSLLLSLTIIVVIVFSTFRTTTVYADGGTTDDPQPTETTSTEEVSTEATSAPTEATAEPATSDQTSADVTVTEAPTETSTDSAQATAESHEKSKKKHHKGAEAAATPEPVSAETSDSAATEVAATPAPTEEAAPVAEQATPTADTSVLEAVPENTTVTVVDANGEVQPLATASAADAVATSDPMWCPAGVAPGGAGCTGSFNSFDALLTFLSQNPTYQGAGTIFVEQGAYQGGESSIDFNSPSYNLSSIRNSDLTVAGGWNPATGTTDSTTPSTFNNTSILIGSSTNPWGGSLVLMNISMGFTPQTSAPAVPVNGLTLYSQGNIALLNVNVTNAPSDGAELGADGSVIISNSKFDRNQLAGARIVKSKGVNVSNSSFSNPANGRRQDTGLDIMSTGDVSLFEVVADQNRQVGTNINTTGAVTISGIARDPLTGACVNGLATCGSIFSNTMLIQGSNFLGYGLQVVTPSTLTISNVTASNNFLWGASLDTCLADPTTGACTASGAIAITDSIFNANSTASGGFIDDTGLIVKGGSTVDLTSVTANDNRLFGATIDSVGAVAVRNSTFSNNTGIITTGGTTTYNGHGLKVVSLAGISLDGVTADNNMLFGAELNAGGDVAVAFGSYSNTSTGSAANPLGVGLDITTTGNVFLNNVTINNNQTVGARITAGGDVSLKDLIVTNNGTDGIIVNGVCTSVSGGTYTGNGGYALNLSGSALDLLVSPTFSGNSSGNVFPTTPAVCALLTSTGGTTTGPILTSAASSGSNVFVSLQSSNTAGMNVPVTGAATTSNTNLTLKSVISTAATGGLQLSIFTGKYVYIYSSAGLQIVALAPASNQVAMQGPFRAY